MGESGTGGRRTGRRVQRPGAPEADPTPQGQHGADAAVRASEDTDRAWGDGAGRNDERLRQDVPPHWGKTH
ncbi:hypothetical protein HII28_06550 [Planctomonas sp. JC2975]|uniref:hypothetical protein n=1 Tax=Planctomonas sp. JC2975 TaxID=2729626 RepID=UPI001473A617|nr:hypothetical protein [Planctomonas sp. JC2975]NNC11538.1 hypothetical protein [Planctomonas sp. JC2975]